MGSFRYTAFEFVDAVFAGMDAAGNVRVPEFPLA
jgi:hypothetical protein